LGEKLITISRLLLPDEVEAGSKSGNLLRQMRHLVRETRRQEPALADSLLYDIGIIRRGSAMEIKLYFFC